jgi:hypothetical protein
MPNKKAAVGRERERERERERSQTKKRFMREKKKEWKLERKEKIGGHRIERGGGGAWTIL